MKRQELLAIAAQFSAYDVKPSDTQEVFEIVNPYGKDSIFIGDEGIEPDTAYIVGFSYYHEHPYLAEHVIEAVRDILEDRQLALTFFKEDRWAGSIMIEKQQVHELTYEALAKRMGWDGITPLPISGALVKLIDKADSFIIRGWGKDTDLDGKFIQDEQGNVSIQVTHKA
jgi:hypothetical protein